jgi:hypothetical protein
LCVGVGLGSGPNSNRLAQSLGRQLKGSRRVPVTDNLLLKENVECPLECIVSMTAIARRQGNGQHILDAEPMELDDDLVQVELSGDLIDEFGAAHGDTLFKAFKLFRNEIMSSFRRMKKLEWKSGGAVVVQKDALLTDCLRKMTGVDPPCVREACDNDRIYGITTSTLFFPVFEHAVAINNNGNYCNFCK